MAGYFKKAPLVFVSAVLRTEAVPPLSTEQWVAVGQSLYRAGLIHAEQCAVNEIDVTGALSVSNTPLSANITQMFRRGFFSTDRTEALIFDKSQIEWRSTQNLKFSTIAGRLNELLEGIRDAVELLRWVSVQEITLSYVDVIVPFRDRALNDYFRQGESILPISVLLTQSAESSTDLQRVGQIQLTRVVAANQKVHMSLEQLPLIGGKVTKFLPDGLLELFPVFGQPIMLRDEWNYIGIENQPYYAMLTTQASVLNQCDLAAFNFVNQAKSLHLLVNKEFRSIINDAICMSDWEFVEE